MLSIGLMSGTSMDGVDAALIFTDGEQEVVELGNISIDYPDAAKILLKAAERAVKLSQGNLKLAEANYLEFLVSYLKENLGLEDDQIDSKISELSACLTRPLSLNHVIQLSTEFHAVAVKKLLEETGRSAKEIDLIGYHGQTVFHDPSHKITVQLGDGEKLAEMTGITVINDFRTRDVLSGGQGAPFAPIYHQALVARDHTKLPVVVLNCGGIANISVIADLNPENLIGFDTGPGNGLVDRWVKLKTRGELSMDVNGLLGQKGVVREDVLRALYEKSLIKNGQNYFDLVPPRSLDINDMEFIPELLVLSLEDGCATLEAFTAMTIIDSLKFLPALGCTEIPSVWVLAGGGWNNPVITRELRKRLAERLGFDEFELKTAGEMGWNNKAMEAQIFAYLAVRSLENKPLSFPSTTRVPRALSGGHAYVPPAGASEKVKILLERNPAVLRGYQPLSDIETLIQEHQESREPPEKLLTTESPHPLTHHLSHLAQTDISKGYQTLIKVDQVALEKLAGYADQISALSGNFLKVLRAGHCIYLTGCGSAARAAIIARKLFSEAYPEYQSQIKTVTGGGELVVVRAAEGFEDKPELGRRQLIEAGWAPDDLLVGISASGAAGFVSGQLEYVLEQGARQAPVFFCCNPLEELQARFAGDEKTVFARGKEDLIAQVNFLNTCVGEMGVSGSTRMQAATVQLAVLAWGLLDAGAALNSKSFLNFTELLGLLSSFLDQIDTEACEALTQFELAAYREKPVSGYVTYKTSPENALNVATDTTERSPTFNISYFENLNDLIPALAGHLIFAYDKTLVTPDKCSRCRIVIAEETDRLSAISKMLGRPPEVLNWREDPKFYRTTFEYLLGYDLTENIIEQRKTYMPESKAYEILIETSLEKISIKFGEGRLVLNLPNAVLSGREIPHEAKLLFIQLALKTVLNMHSTLVAGAMGLYHGNMMTFVRPSNKKLINRGIDFSLIVLKQVNLGELGLPKNLLDPLSKAEVAQYFYQAMRNLRPEESIVFKTRDLVLKAFEAEVTFRSLSKPVPSYSRSARLFSDSDMARRVDYFARMASGIFAGK